MVCSSFFGLAVIIFPNALTFHFHAILFNLNKNYVTKLQLAFFLPVVMSDQESFSWSDMRYNQFFFCSHDRRQQRHLANNAFVNASYLAIRDGSKKILHPLPFVREFVVLQLDSVRQIQVCDQRFLRHLIPMFE